MLLLVGYSCISSVYYVAFDAEAIPGSFTSYFNPLVEFFFWLDLGLNFIQSYVDPESYEQVMNHKLIAKQYIKGWFSIDFVSVFPFESIIPNVGTQTKLFRLFRLPRLIKLIDI